MTMRNAVARGLDAVIGPGGTRRVRAAERRVRHRLARRLTADATTRPHRATGWGPADPVVAHLRPTMTGDQFVGELHGLLRPRTYLEIGVGDGARLAMSRARSIGVDPAFRIDHELHCDLQLVRATSDEFFARTEPVAHLGGLPIDLAVVDGLRLSEFALRDVINVERWLAPTGVLVLRNVLPRNNLEAARDRRTQDWAGDVYKVLDVIARRRPELAVLVVSTAPTGSAVLVGGDPGSTALADGYDDELAFLTRPDPQRPPRRLLDRSAALDPAQVLDSSVWPELVSARTSGRPVDDLVTALRTLGRGAMLFRDRAIGGIGSRDSPGRASGLPEEANG